MKMDMGALPLADAAFIETPGSNADKVRTAIWAYLWAVENKKDMGEWDAYPSLMELREVLKVQGAGYR